MPFITAPYLPVFAQISTVLSSHLQYQARICLIRVHSFNPDVDVPNVCAMCADTPCVKACPVDPDVKTGQRALYRHQATHTILSSGMRAGDVIIAATASENGMPLATGNAKHFKVVKELELKIFKP